MAPPVWSSDNGPSSWGHAIHVLMMVSGSVIPRTCRESGSFCSGQAIFAKIRTMQGNVATRGFAVDLRMGL